MRNIEIEVNGNKYKVQAFKSGRELWVHWNGKTFQWEPERKNRSSSKGGANLNGEIIAPMPGKITKVNCQIGEEVDVGSVLLVMEAMKMEYSLEATCSGKVTNLNCNVGDQVSLGQLLVKVEEEL